MVRRRKTTSSGPAHSFGGDWTTRKLEILKKYLSAYTKVLKKQPFKTGYIDAFAGTGYRTLRGDDHSSDLLFPDLATSSAQELLDGSARIALKIEPRFDRYIFIEKNSERCEQLLKLKEEFPALASDIVVRQGEANKEIQNLCAKVDWKTRRAVLFLDPYGMQVEWATIEAIAATQAIDLWILFPLGIGVSRLLKRSGDIPESWHRRLNLLLGTTEWYEAFYTVESTPTLLGDSEEKVTKASTEVIGRYFNERLQQVFAGVAPKPRVLTNSRNCPLYLFCFAVGNPRGKDIALQIANHILNKKDF